MRNLTWRDISLRLDKSNVEFAKGFWDRVVASVESGGESSQKFGVESGAKFSQKSSAESKKSQKVDSDAILQAKSSIAESDIVESNITKTTDVAKTDITKTSATSAQKSFIDSRDFIDSGAESCAQNRIYTILVNPFNISNPHSISQKGFLQLIEQIASMPQFVVIIPTYKAVHDAFMRDFEKYFGAKPKSAKSSFNDFGADFIKSDSALDSSNSSAGSRINASTQSALENIYIFQNTDDLLNLAALMRHISLCISPSTGTIHIASNQGARTLGLFSRSDSMRWATDDKRYIILEKPLQELSYKEEQEIIAQTLQELESMRAQGVIEPKL